MSHQTARTQPSIVKISTFIIITRARNKKILRLPRNIVTRSQFLVASLYNVNDAAHSIGASHIYCVHGVIIITRARNKKILRLPRNIVARSQFLVASLYNVNDAAHGIRASHVYCVHGATKFR